MTPNGQSDIAPPVGDAGSFAVTAVTAGNDASSITAYDRAGRIGIPTKLR